MRSMRSARAAGIDVLCWESPRYPRALRQAPTAPPVLYLLGSMTDEARLPHPDVRSAAIVGTRRASGRGMAFARATATALADAEVTVVSGLAIGIDTAAHQGAVDAGGRTIAVLGGGVGRIHPPSNQALAARILASGGALMSEQPPDTVPVPYMFPERNRIISGLSRVVAVIEAGERSGASITAGHALEQGRDVYAAPGRPGDPKVAGTLKMLADGAQILTRHTDLAGVFRDDDDLAKARLEPPRGPVRHAGAKVGSHDPHAHSTDPVMLAFSELDEPNLEELARQTTLPVAVLLGRLTVLELRGTLMRTEEGRYRLRPQR